MTAWLSVVGIGEDGFDGLSSDAITALTGAKTIVGAARHLALIGDLAGKKQCWASPWRGVGEALDPLRGEPTVALVSGDPLWYSAGTEIVGRYTATECRFFPNLSAFQLACARKGWSMEAVTTTTIHGRSTARLLPLLAPRKNLIVMTSNETGPGYVAELLNRNGYGRSELTILGRMGSPAESRIQCLAQDWRERDDVPALNVVCIDCLPNDDARLLPRGPGLPDEAFGGAGNFTKSEVRAITLAALWPRPGATLWDIGAGTGSIAIEWLRMVPSGRALAAEPDLARAAAMRANAIRLGTPQLEVIEDRAPNAYRQMATDAPPDAVFIGGGLTGRLISFVLDVARPQTRLVANAVTLESEARLARMQQRHGGELIRIAVQRAEGLGAKRGWRALMPVTQWRLTR